MKLHLLLTTLLCTTILHVTKCQSDVDEDQQMAYLIAHLSQKSLETFWTVVSSLNITVGGEHCCER